MVPTCQKAALGGVFWTSECLAWTVVKNGNENIIIKYVKNQSANINKFTRIAI
jgi:hypothetical protein